MTKRREAVRRAIKATKPLLRRDGATYCDNTPVDVVAVLLDLLREARPWVRLSALSFQRSPKAASAAQAWLSDTADLEPEEKGDAE